MGKWLKQNFLMVLLVFVPVAFVLEYFVHASGLAIFLFAHLAGTVTGTVTGTGTVTVTVTVTSDA